MSTNIPSKQKVGGIVSAMRAVLGREPPYYCNEVRLTAESTEALISYIAELESRAVETPRDASARAMRFTLAAVLAAVGGRVVVKREHVEDRSGLDEIEKDTTPTGDTIYTLRPAVKTAADRRDEVTLWKCGRCETMNDLDEERCEGCGKPREEHDAKRTTSCSGCTPYVHPNGPIDHEPGCTVIKGTGSASPDTRRNDP